MTTGYLWDASYLGHATSRVHPERPERVEALSANQMALELPGIKLLKPDPCLGAPWLGRVHDADYIDFARSAHAHGRRKLDQGDTVVRADSFEVAVSAVSGVLTATRAVADGTVSNAFVACRPPGHHASRSAARGFCIFNNVAIAARFAQSALGLQRVLIVDWDVHPADGTAALFYEDPDVHVLSVHQHGIFTETVGTVDQRGSGDGEGTTYNLPLPKGSGVDDYLRTLEPALDAAAYKARPDIVLISCGFDAHRGDPIGGMRLDEEAFRRFTAMVMGVAKRYAEGRVVSVLEGGYNPTILHRCARAHVETLMA